ncbi:MAG: hypothetical protein AB7G06_01040 [Bdellovibrionales bacterium]
MTQQQPDYTQIAQNMLQMWQEGWKTFATAMTQPASAAPASETKSENPAPDASSPAPDAAMNANWMEGWEKFMASWAIQSASPTETPHEHKPTAQSTGTAAPAAAARAASGERDVLFAELARRVEFLHERLVKMETELERLKRRV